MLGMKRLQRTVVWLEKDLEDNMHKSA